jgi:tetratricopeptide (TPR) repeat protein
MASHLFEAGRFDEALPICERLEPIVENGQDLDDFDTRMELASFYFYMGEMLRLQLEEERAVPRYERALALNSTHLATLEAVGPLYISLERWPEAQKVYRQLLQLSGGQGNREKVADTYTSLGIVEHALGNDAKAQKRFTKALELHPNHVPALKGMAMVLEGQGTWSSLLNVYNNIICHATDADDVKSAYMTKGRILDEHMQRQDKAAQHYQRSLDFEPDQPVAYLRLAELAMRRDAYQEAGALATRALGLDPYLVDEVRPLLLAAKAAGLQDAGKSEEAEAAVNEATGLDAEFGQAAGPTPLRDLEALRQAIKERLPR